MLCVLHLKIVDTKATHREMHSFPFNGLGMENYIHSLCVSDASELQVTTKNSSAAHDKDLMCLSENGMCSTYDISYTVCYNNVAQVQLIDYVAI